MIEVILSIIDIANTLREYMLIGCVVQGLYMHNIITEQEKKDLIKIIDLLQDEILEEIRRESSISRGSE